MSADRHLCPFFRVADCTARLEVVAVSNFARELSRPGQMLRKALRRDPGHDALQGVCFAGPGYISLALDTHGRPAQVLVRLIDRDSGERMSEGTTDARTGLLTFTGVPRGTRCALIAYLGRAKWRAEIWDGRERANPPPLTPAVVPSPT